MRHIRLFIFALAALAGQFAHAQATGQPGQPTPFTAIQIAGSDGTNLRAVKTDSAGVVAVATASSGTTGSTTPTTATLEGITDGTNLQAARQVANSTDSTGTGIPAIGNLAQFDDTATSTVTENNFANLRIDSRRLLYVRTVAPTPINCVVAVSTATTIQAVGGSCVAPGAGLSIYITDIEFGSSAASGTAADSFPTLKSGTGGTCGSGTAVIWQALTAANTTQVANLSQPIKVTANSEICWIMTTAGSKTIQVHGFIAP